MILKNTLPILMTAFLLAACSTIPVDKAADEIHSEKNSANEYKSVSEEANAKEQPEETATTAKTELATESKITEESTTESTTENVAKDNTSIANEYGNVNAENLNRANESFVMTDSTWIYYPNKKDGGSLYKTKPDGSENIKLNNKETTFLNLKNGWIYYTCFSAGPESPLFGIYKIRTDGTEETRISNDYAMYLVLEGDWLYYKKYNALGKGQIYRMKLDGGGSQKLNEIDSWYLNIADGSIYYSGNMSKFYKMKLDGSENTLISKEAAQFIIRDGDWIYYSMPYNRGQIYKCRTVGTEKTKIGTARTDYGMLVLQDWIYYIYTADKKVYKIRKDGTENTKVITDGLIGSLNYLDGWIYYREMEYPYTLYKVKPDGTMRQAIEQKPI